MAYNKQTFIDYPNDGYTILKAEHLNHIENGFDLSQISQTLAPLATETNLNNVGGNAVWLLNDASKYYNYPGASADGGKCVGFLFVNTLAGNWTIQRFYDFSSNATYHRRGKVGESWSAWKSALDGITAARDSAKFITYSTQPESWENSNLDLNIIILILIKRSVNTSK